MKSKQFWSTLFPAVILSACGTLSSATPIQKKPTPRPTATATELACTVAKQRQLPAGIPADFAIALAQAPDGRLFFALRKGEVDVWQDGAAHPFASVQTVTVERSGAYSERGLLGLALSPQFEKDHYVYAFYSDANYSDQHVIRWTDCGGVSSDPTTLVTLPAGPDCCHKGGRIAFGPDGKLYVTLGEEHTASAAQNVNDVRGKILRYNPDGSIPSDNPFGAGNPVYTYGLRNPFGLTFGSSGQMIVTMNGPSGDAGSPPSGYDTFYLNVTKGERFQWPLCYGYSHPLQSLNCAGAAPDWSSETTTYVPTGVADVDSSGPAQYAGHVLFCSDDRGMAIVTAGQPHASVTAGPGDCLLDVIEGTDHAVYYASNKAIIRVA